HTRSYGDWSSDVCSSDLESYFHCVSLPRHQLLNNFHVYVHFSLSRSTWLTVLLLLIAIVIGTPHHLKVYPLSLLFCAMLIIIVRSEDRRLGNECCNKWCM